MDEIYIKVKRQRQYWYRAVHSYGQIIGFLLTAKWNAAARLRRLSVTTANLIDKSGANTVILAALNAGEPDEEIISIRQSKYLNNFVEQSHRNIKRRVRPMPDFKSLRRAQTILAGIELIHMRRKGQYQHQQGEGFSPAEQIYRLIA